MYHLGINRPPDFLWPAAMSSSHTNGYHEQMYQGASFPLIPMGYPLRYSRGPVRHIERHKWLEVNACRYRVHNSLCTIDRVYGRHTASDTYIELRPPCSLLAHQHWTQSQGKAWPKQSIFIHLSYPHLAVGNGLVRSGYRGLQVRHGDLAMREDTTG